MITVNKTIKTKLQFYILLMSMRDSDRTVKRWRE